MKTSFIWPAPGAARFQVENQSRCNFGITICSANWRFRNAHVPYFRSPPLQDLLWPRARAKYFHSNCIVFFYKVTFDTYASKSHSSPAVNTSWHATLSFFNFKSKLCWKVKILWLYEGKHKFFIPAFIEFERIQTPTLENFLLVRFMHNMDWATRKQFF